MCSRLPLALQATFVAALSHASSADECGPCLLPCQPLPRRVVERAVGAEPGLGTRPGHCSDRGCDPPRHRAGSTIAPAMPAAAALALSPVSREPGPGGGGGPGGAELHARCRAWILDASSSRWPSPITAEWQPLMARCLTPGPIWCWQPACEPRPGKTWDPRLHRGPAGCGWGCRLAVSQSLGRDKKKSPRAVWDLADRMVCTGSYPKTGSRSATCCPPTSRV